MYKFYEFSGLKLPDFPPLLMLGLTKAETEPQLKRPTFDLNLRLCAPSQFTEELLHNSNDGPPAKLVLFTANEFDRRARKGRFSATATLPRDQWQAEIDVLLDRVTSRLAEGPQETVEVEFPAFMRQPSKGKLAGPSNDWPLSYPNVGKSRRMGVWTRLYASTLTGFCSQYLSAKSNIPKISRFLLQVPDDEFDNPFTQLKAELVAIRGEFTTRLARCCSRAEFLAALLNTITLHQWPVLSRCITVLMELCQACSTELLPLLQKQALILILTNRSAISSPDMIFAVTQLLAAKLYAQDIHAPLVKEETKH